jgi:hypothetical protein
MRYAAAALLAACFSTAAVAQQVPDPASRSASALAYVFDVKNTYGAKCDGATDDAAAFTNAFIAASAVNGVIVVPPARCRIATSVALFANTTLKCTNAFPDAGDSENPRLATIPALLLDGTATIEASSGQASIIGCNIQRYGMTFPAANSSAYAGIALNDNGHPGFTVIDTVIVGFKTCAYIHGARPYMRRVYMDCAGGSTAGTYGAALEINNGNGDAGYFIDLKLQPIATGNGTCGASLRPGIGIAHGGINFFEGGIVSQNFQQSQFYNTGTALVLGGSATIWTDYIGSLCGFGSTIGVKNEGFMHVASLNLNGTNTGLDNNFFGTNWIGEVFLNVIGQDCIVNRQGILKIGSLSSNEAPSQNCGRYAVEVPATGVNAITWIDSARLSKVNGGVAPYFHSSLAGTTIPGSLSVGNLHTDLAAGTNPYGGFAAQAGSAQMLAPINVTITGSCTGLGTGGTCTLPGSYNNMATGIISLTAGSGAATTGNVTLTSPMAGASGRACTFSTLTGLVAADLGYRYTVSGNDLTVIWKTASGALPAGAHYIAYQCASL